MKLTYIEGNTQKLDGGSMFGNAPKALWKQWMEPDEHNRISLACKCLLLQPEEGKNILIETGIGCFFNPKLKERYGVSNEHVLLKSLESIGLMPDDIHAVVLTHLHFDHAGGMLSSFDEGPLRLIFSKARYFVGKEHWERANNPHIREQASFIPELHTLLQDSGRLILIEEKQHPELPGIRFHVSNGHTIGMMLPEINAPDGPIVFVADLVPGLPWMHLAVTMGYDRFPELLVDEKKRLFEYLMSVNGRLFFTHDPQHACVRIAYENNRYVGKPRQG